MAKLSDILTDCGALCGALGLEGPVNAGLCPFCQDAYSLKVWESSRVWKWTCSNPDCKAHAQGAATVVEALMLADGKSRQQVFSELELEAEAAAPQQRDGHELEEAKRQIEELKRDGSAFSQVLGIQKFGSHCLCPACKDKVMRAGPGKTGDGVYLFQCMKGCGQGSIVDALMLVENIKEPAEAMHRLIARYGRGSPGYKPNRAAPAVIKKDANPKDDRVDPVIDSEKAEQFVNYAHTELTSRDELQDKWLTKRNISLEVAVQFRLGFLERYQIPMLGRDGGGDFTMPVENVWVLPITDTRNKLMAVKLHFEKKLSSGAKSMWLPHLCLEPRHDRVKNVFPRSAYYTLWPHIEQQHHKLKRQDVLGMEWWIKQMPSEMLAQFESKVDEQKIDIAREAKLALEDLENSQLMDAREKAFLEMRDEIEAVVSKLASRSRAEEPSRPTVRDYIVLLGGELKALAAISSGRMATSLTGGDSALPAERHFECFRGKTVLNCLDEDLVKKVENPNNTHLICAARSFGQKVTTLLFKYKAKHVIQRSMGRTLR